MKIEEIYKKEPRLKNLEELILIGNYFDSNTAWYHAFKPIMIRLVGFLAENPAIRDSTSYSVVYHHLSDLVEKRTRTGD